MIRKRFRTIFVVISLFAIHGARATSSAGFSIPHATGSLHLPTAHPFDGLAAAIKWKSECGYGGRICAQAEISGRHLYLLGSSVPATEASRPLHCEAGAKADRRRRTCTSVTSEFFTWSRKFNRVVVAVSAESKGLDSQALVDWLEGIRWEEK